MRYILLDGKAYRVQYQLYQPAKRAQRVVRWTTNNKTRAQTFGVRDEWTYGLTVPYQGFTEGNVTYGSLADLKVAYAKDYVSFQDPYGGSYEVYMVGELREQPFQPWLDQASSKYTVQVTLVRRVT